MHVGCGERRVEQLSSPWKGVRPFRTHGERLELRGGDFLHAAKGQVNEAHRGVAPRSQWTEFACLCLLVCVWAEARHSLSKMAAPPSGFSMLHAVEVQLLMHQCDWRAIIALARTSQRTYQLACTAFAWKHTPLRLPTHLTGE